MILRISGNFPRTTNKVFSVSNHLLLYSGSNHFGIAGWYALRAMEQGLLVSLLLFYVKIVVLFVNYSLFNRLRFMQS